MYELILKENNNNTQQRIFVDAFSLIVHADTIENALLWKTSVFVVHIDTNGLRFQMYPLWTEFQMYTYQCGRQAKTH